MPDKKPVSFHVSVNGFDFTFTQDEIDAASLVKKSPTELHLLHNHRSISAVLREADEAAKNQVLEIEGHSYAVQIRDELDQLLDTMGYSADAEHHIKHIKAPMPGLVLDVYAAEGQHLKAGDKLLVLVAMKMENSILLPADAAVKHVAVTAGQAVEKGQLLVELE